MYTACYTAKLNTLYHITESSSSSWVCLKPTTDGLLGGQGRWGYPILPHYSSTPIYRRAARGHGIPTWELFTNDGTKSNLQKWREKCKKCIHQHHKATGHMTRFPLWCLGFLWENVFLQERNCDMTVDGRSSSCSLPNPVAHPNCTTFL